MAAYQALKRRTGRELDKVSPFNVPEFLFSALFSRNSRLNSRLEIVAVYAPPLLVALVTNFIKKNFFFIIMLAN